MGRGKGKREAASVRAEVRSPVGTPFIRGSRQIPQYRLPLHTSPRRTSNLSLSCTRRIPFCYASFSRYSPTTTPESCHSRAPALIVAIPVMFTVGQKLSPVGGGRGVCCSYDVGPGSGPTLLPVPRIRHARTRFGVVVPAMYFDHIA
jgi:hypothetical protein